MSNTSTITRTPNQNVLAFPPGTTTASLNDEVHDGTFNSDGMPAGYLTDEYGIYELRENEGGDALATHICSPLVVKGRCRTADGSGWGRVLAVQDPAGRWHELVIDTQQLAKSANAALAPLFDMGFELTPTEKAAESVMNLLRTWRPEYQYLRFDRLGWTSNQHDAFALGSGHVIGNTLVATDSVSENLMAAIHSKGTFAAWKKEVAAPCSGNPLMLLAVSHALTGPLLSILGLTGGGFHLRGLSSRGKSTIQYVATSVWGERSLLQSWDGTPSGFEGIAAVCNDTLLNVEELHKADAKSVGEIVYMLANGQGRLRAKSSGKLQTPQRWRVPVLSSGELSLEEHMASAGRKIYAGQEVRLINLEADSGPHGAFDTLHASENGKAFADRLDQACRENYGHAGPIFVEKVMRAKDKEENWRAFIDNFCNVVGKEADVSPHDGQAQRVLKRFALVALAGEMATNIKLTGWSVNAATGAARELFLNWFEDREGTTNKDIATAVQRTQDYVLKNPNRFQTIGTTDHKADDGWRDKDWFYIRPDCWQAMHGEHDPVEMARLHAEGGLLKTQKGGSYQVRMGRSIPGRPRAYAVRVSGLLGSAQT
ncbi:MAG: DUF927 domain-containing protein [Pseudomonadota bacterium]